jgi:hypothetical protein
MTRPRSRRPAAPPRSGDRYVGSRRTLRRRLSDFDGSGPPSTDVRTEIDGRVQHLKKFWFLADAPLLIDQQLVERCYDAIFRPEFEVASRTRSQSDTRSEELSNAVEAAGEASIPTFLKLSAKSSVGVKVGGARSTAESHVEAAVQSAERRLERLANLYLHSYPERLYWVGSDLISIVDATGKKLQWDEVERIIEAPGIRPLVVLDLGKGTRVIPMFAESSEGKDMRLYEALIEAAAKKNGKNKGELVPEYPAFGAPDHDAAARKYWKALFDAFDSQLAIQAIEESARTAGARIDWIDYRFVGFADGIPLDIHLHVSPRGKYPAGVLAYQFVRRGEKYGARVVGTLKMGRDINVLAVYER